MGSGVEELGGVSSALCSSLVSEDLESMLSLGVGIIWPKRSSPSELSSSSIAICT